MTYFDKYNLATSTLTPSTQVFRANSIYDPDYTNTGHQPMYRDQIAALYQQYKVLSVRYDYEFKTSNTNNGLVSLCAYNSAPPTSLVELAEFSRRPPRVLTSTQGVKGTLILQPAVIFGLTLRDYITNSLYNTAIGSNPTATAFVSFQLDAATSTDTGCVLTVFQVLEVLFIQPVDPGTS